jgi:hypothetical protein
MNVWRCDAAFAAVAGMMPGAIGARVAREGVIVRGPSSGGRDDLLATRAIAHERTDQGYGAGIHAGGIARRRRCAHRQWRPMDIYL